MGGGEKRNWRAVFFGGAGIAQEPIEGLVCYCPKQQAEGFSVPIAGEGSGPGVVLLYPVKKQVSCFPGACRRAENRTQ